MPAAAIIFLAVPPVFGNNYLNSILIIIGLYAIVVQGLGILMGYAGQVSFGHAAFFGLGAYTVAILSTRFAVPSMLALVVASLVPALVAAIIGRPTLKLRELYLALATLGFGILVHIAFMEGGALTGGPSGISGIPYLSLGGLVFNNDLKFFYLVYALLFFVLWGINNLINSRIGRALQAVHESEHAAENAGIDTAGLKLRAFIFSALLAGLSGGIYAFYITFINPSPFGFHTSVQFVLMVVIGGLGTFWGPLLGAAAVVLLGEVLRWAVPLFVPGAGGEYQIIFYGLILVAIMIYQPQGLGVFTKCLEFSPDVLPGKGRKEI